MDNSERDGKEGGGLRERKKRETKKRITEKGIALFLKRGVDQTTLDEIAAAAGISRRTFFYYFTSKDEILLSVLSGIGELLTDAVRNAPAGSTPIDAVWDAVVSVCDAIPANDMIELDRLMRTSPSVQARKQAFYVEQEGEIYAALKERWPEPERSTALRTVAMISVGALRVAADIFTQEKGTRPMVELLDEIFGSAAKEIRSHR
ncbi:TetR/AcrR family transcriptional regulator [Mesorhizobium sp. VK23B]|uniref:TetR/AcrR family transcriptional regulator n=1 Tax=Mesorhizobium dulcispinae TaxID=3072316 RepID=A0ABU4XDJ2_9HYPH|nr:MULTISPECIES: TetR/AcrR family transcriptional regulator [unclassified Mesorhizobium]MDX8464924.1 TetR/AcrR family transcriptional regulator [Mesorhizobium sp. VK23B]MDX8472859.1 TetR/AcrR family transcriptional regulator [Mesorhizobium sp. VK23A]